MDNYYDFNVTSSHATPSTWAIISLVVAILGGIFLYVILNNKNFIKDYKGWQKKLIDFLMFKKLLIEKILKVTYLIITIYITLSSFELIGNNFALFLGYLIIGNIIVRLGYEFSLILISIWRNTTEINEKLEKFKKD